jgi:hypothetical protein
MKGDFSRQTFDPARHFTSVRMQQGRVQLDADWNEQADIVRHRAEAEAVDTVGGCGGPLHHAAFGIVRLADLPTAEQQWVAAHYPGWVAGGGDFLLSAGRYYVDGVLVENEHPVPYTRQPDLPGASAAGPAPLANGTWLLYLDVWQRHLTVLEDPRLREVALGGPDTATRTRAVWQVRALSVPGSTTCEAPPAAYGAATAASTGRMRAQARREDQTDDPCVLPSGAGYRGLENQLYRVEIHDAGGAHDLGTAGTWKVSSASPSDRTVTLATAPVVVAGKAVEIYATGAGADPMAGFVAYVVAVNDKTLTLNAVFPALEAGVDYRVRAADATYKWSRDNGTVVTRIRSIRADEVVVESLGQDDVLGFGAGDWVEITDDYLDLNGLPGQLVQVQVPQPATRTLVLRTTPTTLGATDGVDPSRNPRLRRWDGIGAVKTDASVAYGTLEDGVQVAFETGTYRPGDYWLIPARTATSEATTGGVEWPQGTDGRPEARSPAGIRHHYCRLAVVTLAGGNPTLPYLDCRCLFAPLTEVNSLAYVSGAGQEAMPDPLVAGEKVALGQPLVVGIPNGHCQEATALVRFRLLNPGQGDLSTDGVTWRTTAQSQAGVDVPVGADGLARCWWRLEGDHQEQQVEARLLQGGVPVQLPIVFNASLSVADHVAYDPGACAGMSGRNTVQRAIDRLAAFASVYPVAGQAQEVMPGEALDRDLTVLVASDCGPLAGVPVAFAVTLGGGSVGVASVATDASGRATVKWTLDGVTHYQEVVASIAGTATLPVAAPTTATFSATLSAADRVSYLAGTCGPLDGMDTVQEAIDRVVRLVALYPAGETTRELLPGQTWDSLKVLVASDCGPLEKAEKMVIFTAETGTFENGLNEIAVSTDLDGVARAKWTPDATTPYQVARATLNAEVAPPSKEPGKVVFDAWLATAANIAYDPAEGCGDLAAAGVTTVQQAIDYLCSHVGVCCEVTLSPGDDVAAKLNDYMGFSPDLDVCFRPGEYEIAEPVVFKQKRNVRITGRGATSHVLCKGFESVFQFYDCDRVAVREISLEAGTTGIAGADHRLNGVLTFRDCGEVDVEAAVLRCAAGQRRNAACIAATSEATQDGPPREMQVQVRDTEAWVGHRQIGFLVVNPDRAVVEDNVVRLWGSRPGPVPKAALEPAYLYAFARNLGVNLTRTYQKAPEGDFRFVRVKEPPAETRPVVEAPQAPPYVAQPYKPPVASGPVAAQPPIVAQPYQPPPVELFRPGYPFAAGTPLAASEGSAPQAKPVADSAAAGSTELHAADAAASQALGASAAAAPTLAAGRYTYYQPGVSAAKKYAPAVPLTFAAIDIDTRSHDPSKIRGVLEAGADVRADLIDDWIRLVEAVGSQGIVVAGSLAREVRITGNSVQNFLQCIHVGVSHRFSGGKQPADSAGGVTLSDNTLAVKVPYGITSQRHGIFVGNVRSLRVTGNRVTGWSATYDESGPDIEAIRVWGYLGPAMHVVENHVTDCRVAVLVRVLNVPASVEFPMIGAGLWRVTNNVVAGGTVPVDTNGDQRVLEEHNWQSFS